MRGIAIILISATILTFHLIATAHADGGKVEFMDQVEDYRITVFTSPVPFRAGPVDISVFVQDATTGEPATDARITIIATALDGKPVSTQKEATTTAATNKLLKAANFELTHSGKWDIRVQIQAHRGTAQIRLELEAADPLPEWRSWWAWLSWPLIPIALFVVHQILTARRKSRHGPVTEGQEEQPPISGPLAPALREEGYGEEIFSLRTDTTN